MLGAYTPWTLCTVLAAGRNLSLAFSSVKEGEETSMCASLCPPKTILAFWGLLFPNTWARHLKKLREFCFYSQAPYKDEMVTLCCFTKRPREGPSPFCQPCVVTGSFLDEEATVCIAVTRWLWLSFLRIPSRAVTILHSVRIQEFLSSAIQTTGLPYC